MLGLSCMYNYPQISSQDYCSKSHNSCDFFLVPEALQHIGAELGRGAFEGISWIITYYSDNAGVSSRRSFMIFVRFEGKCVDKILQIQHYEKNLFAYLHIYIFTFSLTRNLYSSPTSSNF